ncbi:MAG TPA: class I SAM-dependent methyltransferase [Trebonia sp.]|nr:class I SAM-dependent methyltransferase [Trebonia sp.]
MATKVWGADLAEHYDEGSASMFDPAVLGPTVDVLAELARAAGGTLGRALELAVGTGRVALPLAERGVPVAGIELSPHMAQVLRAKPGADAVPVTVGDMTTTRLDGTFTLVYLVFNTIMNVTTQDEQVIVFENAAAHLSQGGRFVVEVGVPTLAGLPGADPGRVFDLSPGHVGIDTLDDPVGQIISSHHWTLIDGAWMQSSAPFRYVWPSELDLMARLAGLRLEHRWSGWDKSPFTAASTTQVAVYLKP